MSSRTAKPRLYALLVAIDHYVPPVSPLMGCVNDLEKMTAWLQKESSYFDVTIRTLLNERATKAAVTEQFKNHLGQASGTNGDVAFFYYSGHGTQEDADPVFWTIDENRKLEALVCFDSYTIQKDGKSRVNLLADKELRYLIHQIAQNEAHVLTIFDCCHSGGNTRNAYITEQEIDVRERRYIHRERLSQAFPVRKWNDFIFSDEIPYEKAKQQPFSQLLPEGKHIQMAACQNDQSAFEVAGEGVFTKNLVDVLIRSKGAVTYYDLQSRIQNYMRNQFDQTPRVYISGEDESGLFRGFLNKDIEGKPLYGNINYNAGLGWVMDIGAMQGVSSQATAITVFTEDEQTKYEAEIEKVYPSYTLLRFEDPPDAEASYKGFMSDYFSSPTGVFLHIKEETLRKKLQERITTGNADLFIADEPHKADYCVQNADNQLFITRAGSPEIPVVQPQKIQSEGDLAVILNYLIHLSQFEFVKNLHNPNTYLFANNPVEIRIFKTAPGQKELPVPIKDNDAYLEYDRLHDDRWGGSIRIALKNHTDRKLYCALMYLSFNFGVSTKLLKEVAVGLAPNREVWALDGAPIGLKLEDEMIAYPSHYKESISYLKLIVSTSDFQQQAARFEMPPLPKPAGASAPGTKGLEMSTYNPGNIEDWTTRLVTVRIKNPLYKA